MRSNSDGLGLVSDLNALQTAEQPYLIGVRHHSPALSWAIPDLLTAAAPQVVALELPVEAQPWLEWMGHPQAQAPLAFALADTQGGLFFYPFADFSPELAAIRWAHEHQIPVVCIDLSLRDRTQNSSLEPDPDAEGGAETANQPANQIIPQLAALLKRGRTDEFDEAWDRTVEAFAPGSSPEQIRKAALAYGLTMRQAEGETDTSSVVRETYMRQCLAGLLSKNKRIAAVIGSFHAAALLNIEAADTATKSRVTSVDNPVGDPTEVQASLVGYSFAQLDSRSGYPAGIRDPYWQQLVFQAQGDPAKIDRAAGEVLTKIARKLRKLGHPTGPAEAAEAWRLAADLATIRGLPTPSRRELIEAITTVYAQGDLLGRGRAVAKAAEQVLVTQTAGQVAPGTPQSALRGTIRNLLAELKLPTSESEAPRKIRLEPLRGGLDLRRYVTLRRLQTAGIIYGLCSQNTDWRGTETIGQNWEVAFSAATAATIELAAVRGVSLEQISEMTLRNRIATANPEIATNTAVDLPPELWQQLLTEAADCALGSVVTDLFDSAGNLLTRVDFASAVSCSALLADVATRRLPGAQLLAESVTQASLALSRELLGAAIREIEGISGSNNPADARALAGFATISETHPTSFTNILHELIREGSALMQGAALGVIVRTQNSVVDEDDLETSPDGPEISVLIGSWIHASTTPQQRQILRSRCTGLFLTAGGLTEVSSLFDPLVTQIEQVADPIFVSALPALRGAADAISPADRTELLAALARRHQVHRLDLTHEANPEEVAQAAAYDTAAKQRLAALGLADISFAPAERWRLILGCEPGKLSNQGQRMASALDELYGQGRGEGAAEYNASGAGVGPSQVGVRVWAEEITALFGDHQREEILAEAANNGRADVLELLDPGEVRPSVELLTTVLSLQGALSEERLNRLRPLVNKLVADLSKELAQHIRPALAGIDTGRPTRHDTGRLDLARTLRSNLKHVVSLEGRPQVVPAHPVFIQPGAMESDWHIIVLVDVSGSMEASTVFAALTAAILSGVRTLEISFITFSTEVIDLTGQVSDPLSLLLEIAVGGGTNIFGALRYARTKVRVPSRTMVVLISDFEEGGPIGPMQAEIKAMSEAGVHLLGCAALDDSGTGVYNVGIASQMVACGMRVACVTPLELARWVGEVVRS